MITIVALIVSELTIAFLTEREREASFHSVYTQWRIP